MSPLCDVKKQERHHEGEKTSGFSESETQNGILEELTTERWVTSNTLDETSEHRSDTNTSTSKTNSGDTSTLNLGGSNHGSGGRFSNDATRLDHVASHVASKGSTGSVVESKAISG
jgi:hypothetical protein